MLGWPWLAMRSAHKVGHNNKKMPMGLSRRIR